MPQIIIMGLVMVNMAHRTELVTTLDKKEDFTTMRRNKIHLTIIQENLEVIDTLNTVEGTDLDITDTD